MAVAKSTCGIDVMIAGPRCAFPPEDEALLVDAIKAGATDDEKTALIKQLLEKNGLPWLDDEPPNWSEPSLRAMSDSGVSEIRLRATSAGCLVQVKEAHTGMNLTCLAWTFPSVAEAARAIGHAFESPEPPHHELLERIIAYARTSDQRQ